MSQEPALVDTHCHVDLFDKPRSVVEEAENNAVYTIAVTNAPSVYRLTELLTKGARYVRPAVGFHPELVSQRDNELTHMWTLLERTRYVGEVGLDYGTTDEMERRKQREVFTSILEHCDLLGDKILTIHSRGAAADVISAIGSDFNGNVILHWYSGSFKELEMAVSYGFYFSVNSAMARSKRGQLLISRIPCERILTETDGPFVTIDRTPATPNKVSITIARLASLWKMSPEAAKVQVFDNFKAILELYQG